LLFQLINLLSFIFYLISLQRHKEHKGYCSFNLLIFYPSSFISFHHKGQKIIEFPNPSSFVFYPSSFIFNLLSHFTTKAQRTQKFLLFQLINLLSFIFHLIPPQRNKEHISYCSFNSLIFYLILPQRTHKLLLFQLVILLSFTRLLSPYSTFLIFYMGGTSNTFYFS
jgi:hypothetical protein